MMTRLLAETVSVLKALAHPTRLRILAMLLGGELCVCQITAVLGAAASTVSAHLAELRRAGLLIERKDGRWVYYALAERATAADGPVPWEVLRDDRQLAEDAELVAKLREIGPEEICRVGLDLERLGLPRRCGTTRS